MDNATLKFALIAGIAVLVLYTMRRTEMFTAFDGSSRFEKNAAFDTVVKPSSCSRKPSRKPSRKHALLRAATRPNQPKGTGTGVNMLPKPAADLGFGQFAPNPKELMGQNFVDASRWVSLGAMSSKRNINRDLRSDIPIPKNNGVSPWNQSTIEQQSNQKSLDCP